MGQGFVVFDGRVLEQWQPTKMGATRLHVAIIGKITIQNGRGDERMLNVDTTFGSGNALIPFVEAQRPHVEHLIQLLGKSVV